VWRSNELEEPGPNSWIWWLTSVILALRQENSVFMVSLGYRVRNPVSSKKKKKTEHLITLRIVLFYSCYSLDLECHPKSHVLKT
jgi:hypothetical protein